jgi:hypothetical protein
MEQTTLKDGILEIIKTGEEERAGFTLLDISNLLNATYDLTAVINDENALALFKKLRHLADNDTSEQGSETRYFVDKIFTVYLIGNRLGNTLLHFSNALDKIGQSIVDPE